jgi:sirohydrochlorin ferrochelatase
MHGNVLSALLPTCRRIVPTLQLAAVQKLRDLCPDLGDQAQKTPDAAVVKAMLERFAASRDGELGKQHLPKPRRLGCGVGSRLGGMQGREAGSMKGSSGREDNVGPWREGAAGDIL